MPWRASFVAWSLGSVLATAIAAQTLEETVVVEQRADIPARNRVRPLLVESTVTVRGPLGMRDLCRVLSRACGDALNFQFQSKEKKADDVPPLEVDLQRATPLQVLALLRDQLDLQAVWRAGSVALMPRAEVKEATWLQIYDVRAETMPLRSFPAPRLFLRAPGDDAAAAVEDEEPKTTASGFTAEQLVELVREHAARGAWQGSDVSITAQGGILMVRQTERGHRSVREVLAALGIAAAAPPIRPRARPAATPRNPGAGLREPRRVDRAPRR
jgi:hypothetical protein